MGEGSARRISACRVGKELGVWGGRRALTLALSLRERGKEEALSLALSLRERGKEEALSLALSIGERGEEEALTHTFSRRERGFCVSPLSRNGGEGQGEGIFTLLHARNPLFDP